MLKINPSPFVYPKSPEEEKREEPVKSPMSWWLQKPVAAKKTNRKGAGDEQFDTLDPITGLKMFASPISSPARVIPIVANNSNSIHSISLTRKL